MKHKIFLLFAALCVTIAGWGYNASSAYVYFDNTNSNWTTEYISIMIGHSTRASVYPMTHIDNTNLYYKSDFSWSNYDGLEFIGTSSEWSSRDEDYYTRRTYATKYTNRYQVSLDKYSLFVPSGSENNTSISYSHDGSDYKKILHKGQTLKIYLSTDGGYSYSESATWYGTFTADYYQMATRATTEAKNKTLASSSEANATATCVRSSEVTFTESATTSGYTFMGWGETADAPTESGATYAYTVTGTKTVYAFFMDNSKNLVVTSEDDAKGTVTGDTRGIVSFDNPYTITATPAEGYVFDRWVVTNGSVEYVNGTSETDATAQINISDNVAMHATFKAPLTIYYVPLASDAASETRKFKLNVQYTPVGGSSQYVLHSLVKTDETYHCRPIYKYELFFDNKNDAINTIQLQVYEGSEWQSQIEKTSPNTIAEWHNKMVVPVSPSDGRVLDVTFSEPMEEAVSLVGTFNSWGSAPTPHHFIRQDCSDNIVYFTQHLSAGTSEFKIINNYNAIDQWRGNGGTMTASTTFSTWWDFSSSVGDNCKLEVTVEADYVFALNLDEMRLRVYYPVNLTITAAGYASYFGDKNLEIPAGLKAEYVTNWNNTILTWEELSDYIPANEGVILSGAPGDYTANVTVSTESATGNMLKGSLTDETIDNTAVHYILSAEMPSYNNVGLYWPSDPGVTNGVGAFTNHAGKAYLELPGGASLVAPRRYVFGQHSVSTGLDATPTDASVRKTIKDGNLLILNGDRMYNAQGIIVK